MIVLRSGVLLAALTLSVPAWAQYVPFQPPGGLATATVVGSQTLGQMQAATAVAQSVAAGSVPAATLLDVSSRVKLPVSGDVTSAAVTPAGGVATVLGTYLGTLATSSDLVPYLTAATAADTYATISALGVTSSVAESAQTIANAAMPSASVLDANGRMKLGVSGDVSLAPVTPTGGSATLLGAYLGTLAPAASLAAYLTATSAAGTYATIAALATTTTMANAALPAAQRGVAGGVAGLNAAGQVTAPVVGDLTNAVATPAGGAQVTIGAALASYALQSGLLAEATRAQGAEATLLATLNTEATTRADADALLMPLAGGVLSGPLTVGTSYPVSLDGIAGSFRQIQYSSSGSLRWAFGVGNDPESGGNAGGSFYIARYGDAGGSLGTVLTISRSTDVVAFTVTPTAPISAAGDSSANVATTSFVRASIATPYTVSALPMDARRYPGAQAYVTDATACAFNSVPMGGGSTFCRVTYSGSAWLEM